MQRLLIRAARILGPILLTKFLRDRKQKKRALAEQERQQHHIDAQIDETPTP
jgi:hypothetical protein